MKKLFCIDENKELKYTLVDGYGVGDRLLEGVMFRISLVNDKPKAIIDPSYDDEYFEGLNREYWYKILEEDFDIDDCSCPYCDGEIEIRDV